MDDKGFNLVVYDVKEDLILVLIDDIEGMYIWDYGAKFNFRVSFNLTDNDRFQMLGVL